MLYLVLLFLLGLCVLPFFLIAMRTIVADAVRFIEFGFSAFLHSLPVTCFYPIKHLLARSRDVYAIMR